jgi:hypothetical protein
MPRLWSVNRLCRELDMDWRTVERRLRTVPPAGRLNGHPAWRLDDALAVLRPDRRSSRSAASGQDEPDDPFVFKGQEGKFAHGILVGRNTALLGLPTTVAILALDHGLPLDVAARLGRAVLEAVADQWKELTGPAVAWPPLPSLVTEIDVKALRERAGASGWTPPDGGDEDGAEASATDPGQCCQHRA